MINTMSCGIFQARLWFGHTYNKFRINEGGAIIKRFGGTEDYDPQIGRNASGASRQQGLTAQKRKA